MDSDILQYSLAYDGDINIISIAKYKPFEIKFILLNSFMQENEFKMSLKLGCTIWPADLQSVEGELFGDVLEASLQAEKVGEVTIDYSSSYEKIVQTVQYDELKEETCGPIEVELKSDL